MDILAIFSTLYTMVAMVNIEKSIAIDEIINNKFNTKTFHYDES